MVMLAFLFYLSLNLRHLRPSQSRSRFLCIRSHYTIVLHIYQNPKVAVIQASNVIGYTLRSAVGGARLVLKICGISLSLPSRCQYTKIQVARWQARQDTRSCCSHAISPPHSARRLRNKFKTLEQLLTKGLIGVKQGFILLCI